MSVIPRIDALLTAFYEIDLAKAANELVYSRGEPGRFTCVRCGQSYRSPVNGDYFATIGPCCLDCTCGDPFR